MDQRFDLKYRPQRISGLVGQAVPARYLSRLTEARKHRNLICAGPSGCGKTSAARLYGKALNCLDLQPGGEPCGACLHCTLQAEDRFPDYREQEVGTNGGVEAIRALLESARTPPLQGRTRVIVLDEAHNLTASAFETLKGILEEPPPFLAFVLTTTRPDKIIADIRQRCSTIQFKRIGPADAVAHLRTICAAEGLAYENGALELIAHLSRGELRPLAGLLDQLSDFGEITIEHARMVFDLGYVEHLPRLFHALLCQGLPETLAAANAWDDEPERIVDTWREFVLWLQCRAAGAADVAVNPLFGSMPAGMIRSIVDAMGEKARAAGLTLEEGLHALAKALGLATIPSRLLLCLMVRDLHNLIHLQHFDTGRMGAPVSPRATAAAAAEGKPGGKRRQLAANYVAGRNGVAHLPGELDEPAPTFTLAPPVGHPGVPTFSSPPTLATPTPFPFPDVPPPRATMSLSSEVAPPDPEDERLPPDATAGEFAWTPPSLPARKPVFPSDLTLKGWTAGPAPTAVFAKPKEQAR